MKYNKKFLIIGNMNAITFKEIFPLIRDNKLWEGVSLNGTKCQFDIPENYDGKNVFIDEYGKRKAKINNAIWFTNIEHKLRKTPLDLYKTYIGREDEYHKYDNYDAINVDKVSDIPIDYDGVIGVPITFLYKYCPSQFEIIDINPHFFTIVSQGLPKPKQLTLHNVGKKDPFARILIKRKKMMKKFLIIGNMNAVITKEIFPLIKYNKLWLGVTKVHEFIQPDSSIKKFGNICWYTNIDHKKLHEPIAIYKHYSDVLYPKYDNYDAINVDRVKDIPMDYDGVIGVPLTFIERYCPEQFEIVWRGGDIEWAENECDFYTPPTRENAELYKKQDRTWRIQNPYLLDGNGDVRTVYSRIFIRLKKQ